MIALATPASICNNVCKVIRGKNDEVKLVVTAILSGGHVLLEDVPGTGKTTLAKALAISIGGDYKRVQCTPDLMPADITGSEYYRPNDGQFTFREGPIFTNILLADEINRTSPRTQSALLEAMSESQVTIDGESRSLPNPFFVIATQNSSDFHGTYPLPEAQLDRFAIQLSLGYPSISDERIMLREHSHSDPLSTITSVISGAEVRSLQECVRRVHVEDSVSDYILDIVGQTRMDPRLRLPVSPRGALILYRMSQAFAFVNERDYVSPDDVQHLAIPVLAHRIILEAKAKYAGGTPLQSINDALEKSLVPR